MSSAANTDGQPTLKVMRLYKPKLHMSQPVPCAPPISNCCDAAQMPLFKDTPFALSNFFILPDSFGNIYLGETFCSYISVLNPYAYDLEQVGLKADLQSRAHRKAVTVIKSVKSEFRWIYMTSKRGWSC